MLDRFLGVAEQLGFAGEIAFGVFQDFLAALARRGIGVGDTVSAMIANNPDGDGELAEGSNWEAGLAAAHYKLDNLVAILDWNSTYYRNGNSTYGYG